MAGPVKLGKGPLAVMARLADPSLVPLGRGVPDPDLLPAEKLSRMLAAATRHRAREAASTALGSNASPGSAGRDVTKNPD